jgi:type IV pilus assembly protein PilA
MARDMLSGLEAMGTTSMRRRARGSRGFTLTEMLIVVAMIAVLAAIALVGYKRYINQAQAGEAKTVIQMIRGGQETYKAEMLQYLSVSTMINSYYPNQNPNDTRNSWFNNGHPDYANWMLLNVNPDGPVRFGYACVAGLGGAITPPSDFAPPPNMPPALALGVSWYSIQARNRRNNGTSPPVLFSSVSTDNNIVSQDQSE